MFHRGARSAGVEHSTIKTPLRREEVLAFIIQCLVKDRVSPTLREIALAVGVEKTRARELVNQLVGIGIVQKTPGAQRNLRIRDVSLARELILQDLNELGVTTAAPMADLQHPRPNVHLPKVLEIRHLPDQ